MRLINVPVIVRHSTGTYLKNTARNVVNFIRFYYVLCLILFCFVVDLFITSTTHPTNIYIYIYLFVGCVVLVINKSTTKQNNMRHST